MRRLMHEPEIVELQRALRRVLGALRRRAWFAPVLREPFEQGRLGPRHASALTVVAREEPLSVGDLSTHLGVSLTTASLLASELAATTLVDRTEDSSDRRRTILTLAERWRPFVLDWLDDRAAPLHRALTRLEPADRESLVRGLTALAEELEADAPPGCGPRHRRRRGPRPAP